MVWYLDLLRLGPSLSFNANRKRQQLVVLGDNLLVGGELWVSSNLVIRIQS